MQSKERAEMTEEHINLNTSQPIEAYKEKKTLDLEKHLMK